MHYRGIEYLPARISITDEVLVSAILKKLEPEERAKFDAFWNHPLGSYSSFVEFFGEDDNSLATIFIYPDEERSEFNDFVAEIKEGNRKDKKNGN